MSEEEKIQLIDDFLTGRLSAEKANDFQQQLLHDPILSKEVEMHRLMLIAIEEDAKIAGLVSHLQTLEKEHKLESSTNKPALNYGIEGKSNSHIIVKDQSDQQTSQPKVEQNRKVRLPLWKWITGVAAIIAIGLVCYLFLVPHLYKDSQYETYNVFVIRSEHYDSLLSLFDQYYQAYPIGGIHQSDIKNATRRKDFGNKIYRKEDRIRAINNLESYLKNNPNDYNNIHSLLRLGTSYLEIGLYMRAIEFLEKSINIPTNNHNSIHKDFARWYLALAYLKADQAEKAIPHLKILRDANSELEEQASELLLKLSDLNIDTASSTTNDQ